MTYVVSGSDNIVRVNHSIYIYQLMYCVRQGIRYTQEYIAVCPDLYDTSVSRSADCLSQSCALGGLQGANDINIQRARTNLWPAHKSESVSAESLGCSNCSPERVNHRSCTWDVPRCYIAPRACKLRGPGLLQDPLALEGLRFLTTMARGTEAKLLGTQQVLQQICQAIVAPNMMLREDDEELFEFNYVEYIRRLARGQGTRVKAASYTEWPVLAMPLSGDWTAL